MTVHRISRLVFWLNGALVSNDAGRRLLPGMAGLLDELAPGYELWLVSCYPARQTAAVISENALSRWFGRERDYVLPDDVVNHGGILSLMVTAGVVQPGKSLWIDDHPVRTMLAIRQGIDAGIFVDARRLRRDLWLWGIVD
jgi:hypothetical protein